MLGSDFPQTLVEFDEQFGTEQACREHLMRTRWPQGWRCPRCDHDKAWTTVRNHLHCARCGHQSSLTAGTVMHSTKKPLVLWFKAMYLMVTFKNGLSAKTLQDQLGLSYQTAWAWLHKLRRVMVLPHRAPLGGTVEVDETYIGSDPSNRPGRHKGQKVLVVIAVEDQGSVMGRARMTCVPDASGDSLAGMVEANVAPGSTVHTDGAAGYVPVVDKGYVHRVDVISKGKTRAERADRAAQLFPHVHRLAALLQRWLLGTHQGAVSEKHLQAYLDEFVFRFNRRRSKHRTHLFQRLAEQAMARQALPYWKIVGRTARDKPLHLAVA